MPNISAACDRAILLIVIGNFNAVQDTLGRNDLIRAHHEQQVLRSEDTVFCQDIEDSVLGEKGLCEVHDIRNDLIICISPKGSKLKAVASFGLFTSLASFLDSIETCSIGIILRVRAVGDNKYLHILKKTAACPKTVTLIAVYLIERLTDRHTTPF